MSGTSSCQLISLLHRHCNLTHTCSAIIHSSAVKCSLSRLLHVLVFSSIALKFVRVQMITMSKKAGMSDPEKVEL